MARRLLINLLAALWVCGDKDGPLLRVDNDVGFFHIRINNNGRRDTQRAFHPGLLADFCFAAEFGCLEQVWNG